MIIQVSFSRKHLYDFTGQNLNGGVRKVTFEGHKVIDKNGLEHSSSNSTIIKISI